MNATNPMPAKPDAPSPAARTGRMTGAEAVIRCLEAEGVDICWGIPGGAILPIYDAWMRVEHTVKHVLCRHEQAAGHMAQGYARVTGKVGVCMATSGPGATNLVTPIADAFLDSTPLIAITGQVPTHLIGTDAFQEADITGIVMPIVKHSYLVQRVEDLPRAFKEAFHIARTGRPGPVLIDIPKDVANATFEFAYPETVDLPGYRPTREGHPLQIQAAADAIAKAKRPVLYVGGGIVNADASAELAALAEATKVPVVTTLMAKGAFPDSHPLSLQMPGMHGSKYANWAMNRADLLITVGARFDDRVTGKLDAFAPGAKVIHMDIDPAEISKNREADVPIVGELKQVLPALTAAYLELARAGPHPRQARVARPGRGVEVQAPVPLPPGRRAASRSTCWSASATSCAARTSSGSPASASTRCGPRSGCRSTRRAAGSRRAASAPWASASRRPSAPSRACRTPPSSTSTATAASR